MRKPSTRAIALPAAASKPVASKPVAAKLAVSKPNKPVAAKPTAEASPVANTPRGLTRDAAGIVRAATNFEQISGRDDAYLRFFGTVTRPNNGSATLRQIFDAGQKRDGENERNRYNPFYAGSAKATDIGAINRQIKAGNFTRSADGHTITATAKAKSTALYNGKAS